MRYKSEERDIKLQREQIRNREKRKKENRAIYGVFVFLVVCAAMMLVLSALAGKHTKKVKVPYSHSYFEKLDWEEAEMILDSAGFSNISCIPTEKKPGLLKDDGQVISISIDGNPQFQADKEYPHNAAIIINYYPDA